MNVASIYKAIVSDLTRDHVLGSILNNVYEQEPRGETVIPYMYAHLEIVLSMGTVDHRAKKAKIVCNAYSYELEETIRISERTKELSINFFYLQSEHTLGDVGYRIIHVPHHQGVFRSVIRLEVMNGSDCCEISK